MLKQRSGIQFYEHAYAEKYSHFFQIFPEFQTPRQIILQRQTCAYDILGSYNMCMMPYRLFSILLLHIHSKHTSILLHIYDLAYIFLQRDIHFCKQLYTTNHKVEFADFLYINIKVGGGPECHFTKVKIIKGPSFPLHISSVWYSQFALQRILFILHPPIFCLNKKHIQNIQG